MEGAGAATATAANRETKSTLESMTMKHRENVNKITRTSEHRAQGASSWKDEKKIDSHQGSSSL